MYGHHGPVVRRCVICRKPIPPERQRHGRHVKYCSTACRARASAARDVERGPRLPSPPRTPKFKVTPGYVYILRCEHFYKIGVTKRPESRSWETDNPFDLEIVRLFPSRDMRRAESRLHAMFSRFHHRGEWFVLPEACVAWIQTIADIDATDVIQGF